MSLKIPSLNRLIHELSRLPGIGEKTAQRLAYYVLKTGEAYSSSLQEALRDVVENIQLCQECFSYTENRELCHTCEDSKRDPEILCVVEDPYDIHKIESSHSFQGRFHVLHGIISPLEGVRPEDLKIQELMDRIHKSQESGMPIQEVVLALDADLEGDTTTLYLSKLLRAKGIRVTRIAYGVPFGTDINYIDQRTLSKAIENRVEV